MKKLIATALLTLILLLAGCSGDTYRTVTILSLSGTVSIERSEKLHTAREGMKLTNLDTVHTAAASTAWLKLDSDKAAQLSERTALRVNRQASGFALTLIEGEIMARIDKPLAGDEGFFVRAGNAVLGVRGTVFTVLYQDETVTVWVESGVVAVMDRDGNEMDVLTGGESGQYNAVDAAPAGAVTAPEPGQTQEPMPEPDTDNTSLVQQFINAHATEPHENEGNLLRAMITTWGSCDWSLSARGNSLVWTFVPRTDLEVDWMSEIEQFRDAYMSEYGEQFYQFIPMLRQFGVHSPSVIVELVNHDGSVGFFKEFMDSADIDSPDAPSSPAPVQGAVFDIGTAVDQDFSVWGFRVYQHGDTTGVAPPSVSNFKFLINGQEQTVAYEYAFSYTTYFGDNLVTVNDFAFLIEANFPPQETRSHYIIELDCQGQIWIFGG